MGSKKNFTNQTSVLLALVWSSSGVIIPRPSPQTRHPETCLVCVHNVTHHTHQTHTQMCVAHNVSRETYIMCVSLCFT